MIRRFVVMTVLPLLLPVLGCGADEGEQADAESLASLFCRTTLGVDETAQPEQFSSCVRRTLPPATVYSDCLAGAGEFAVESEMFDCEDEADWSPYEDRSQ